MVQKLFGVIPLDPETRWELCDPLPPSEELTGEYGSGYRGKQNKTLSGKTCQKWNSQSPQKHKNTPENKPNSGLGDHNFCRNPDGETGGIWCYTTDPEKDGNTVTHYHQVKKV